MIRFKCPGCLHLHSANPTFAGMTARCINCGERMRVPSGLAHLAARSAGDPHGDPDDSDFLLDPGDESDGPEDTKDVPESGSESRRKKPSEPADDADVDEPSKSPRSRRWIGWLSGVAA